MQANEVMRVRLTFTEEILGTASNNPEIHGDFIASKAPDAQSREEEIAAIGVDGEIEKSMTVFPRNDEGKPILFDYQVRGYFKESCGFLRKVKDSASSKVKAYKKTIDGLVFIKPRMIPFEFEGDIGGCQRPLRGQTAQGERIALANSETIPIGATCEFEVHCFCKEDMTLVREWLDYGEWHGLGQWRNSGKGKFVWEELDDNGKVIGGNKG